MADTVVGVIAEPASYVQLYSNSAELLVIAGLVCILTWVWLFCVRFAVRLCGAHTVPVFLCCDDNTPLLFIKDADRRTRVNTTCIVSTAQVQRDEWGQHRLATPVAYSSLNGKSCLDHTPFMPLTTSTPRATNTSCSTQYSRCISSVPIRSTTRITFPYLSPLLSWTTNVP